MASSEHEPKHIQHKSSFTSESRKFVGFSSLRSFLGTGSPLASLLVVFSAVVFSPVIFFTAVFSATSFAFLAFLSAFFLALSSVLLAFSSAFCFYICSLMAFFSSCSFLLCSYCSVASCFWHSFSSSCTKQSALVRRCAHGRAFWTVGMEMVGETRYLDIGELVSQAAGYHWQQLVRWLQHTRKMKPWQNCPFDCSTSPPVTTSRRFSIHKWDLQRNWKKMVCYWHGVTLLCKWGEWILIHR